MATQKRMVAVVIGRNEGARLKACLSSLLRVAAPAHMPANTDSASKPAANGSTAGSMPQSSASAVNTASEPTRPEPTRPEPTRPEPAGPEAGLFGQVPDVPTHKEPVPLGPDYAAGDVVYVDSGSSDGSADYARSLGVHVVDLDMSVPFTAARARNSGVAYITAQTENTHDLPAYIQFIDGDCEMIVGWKEAAYNFLETHVEVAALAGRVQEKFPDRSVYNRLCDMEWAVPAGDAQAVGGISVMRYAAFEAVGGFNPALIAGEEPELCLRLKRAGHSIHRLSTPMCHHDADITRFKQWWGRTRRSGYAYALGAALHGQGPERYNVRDLLRILVWTGYFLFVLLLALALSPWYLLMLMLYAVQIVRMGLRGMREHKAPHAFAYAFFVSLGRFAQFFGFCAWVFDVWRGHQAAAIDYKGTPSKMQDTRLGTRRSVRRGARRPDETSK